MDIETLRANLEIAKTCNDPKQLCTRTHLEFIRECVVLFDQIEDFVAAYASTIARKAAHIQGTYRADSYTIPYEITVEGMWTWQSDYDHDDKIDLPLSIFFDAEGLIEFEQQVLEERARKTAESQAYQREARRKEYIMAAKRAHELSQEFGDLPVEVLEDKNNANRR